MYKKILRILKESLPVLVMILCIPFIKNDVILTGIYISIIVTMLMATRKKHDILILVIGFIAMTIFELFFIATGVETFVRNSLFGFMPLWLPFLWAYGFVVIKRSIHILEER